MKDKAFAWSLVVLTVGIFAVLLTNDPDFPPRSTMIFWIVLLLAVELLPVSLGFASVTMGFPIYLAVAVLFSPAASMIIAGVGAFDPREAKREIALHHALFNRAQLILSVGAASAVFTPFRDDLDRVLYATLGAALAAITYTTINLALVAIWIHLREHIDLRTALKGLIPQPATGFWISYLLLAGLGIAIAIVYDRIDYGALTISLFLTPLLFARVGIQGAKAQVELSERIQEQQKSLLEATERVFSEREEERKAIAAQIHDSSLQMLAAATYGISNAEELIERGREPEARNLIGTAREAIDGAITSLRGSLKDLRKSSIEQGGLMETARVFTDQASTLWNVEINLEGGVEQEPPLPVALAAFQILQEGLTNSLKHASNGSITVRIGEDAGMVHIVVEDHGPGFDTTAEVGAEHVGMQLMKERAARVGGRIELDSELGRGTRLEAILPGGVAQ